MIPILNLGPIKSPPLPGGPQSAQHPPDPDECGGPNKSG
jgi:hypothetical protein